MSKITGNKIKNLEHQIKTAAAGPRALVDGGAGFIGSNLTTGSFNTSYSSGNVTMTGGNGATGGTGGKGGNGGVGGSGGSGNGGAGTVGLVGGVGGVGGAVTGGGLVGQNTGTISNAYARGSVTITAGTPGNGGTGGDGGNGGAAGGGSAGANGNGANGGVGGAGASAYAGGLLGSQATSVITNTYSTGAPSGTKTSGATGGAAGSAGTGGSGGSAGSTGATGSSASVQYSGGLTGLPTSGTYASSYWDTDTSGFATGDGVGNGVDPSGMTGKTTAEMKQEATFTSWDFSTPLWDMVETSTYPYFNYQYAPDAPTSIVAVGGNGEATITFIAPVNTGGGAITSYTVTSSPGGITATGGTSPIVITGLTNGTTYTFTVTATNDVGTGSSSATSNSVVPATTPDAPTIGTATHGNGQVTVTFSAPASFNIRTTSGPNLSYKL